MSFGFDMSKATELGNGLIGVVGTYTPMKQSRDPQYAIGIGEYNVDGKTGQKTLKPGALFIPERYLLGEDGKTVGDFLKSVYEKIASGNDEELKKAKARATQAERVKTREIRNAKETLDDILELSGPVYTDYDPQTRRAYDAALEKLQKLDPDAAENYVPTDAE